MELMTGKEEGEECGDGTGGGRCDLAVEPVVRSLECVSVV